MTRKPLHHRFRRFLRDVSDHTPFARLVVLLVLLWLAFAGGLYYVEHTLDHATITTFGEALYWGVAAFSTAGIADTPVSALGQLIGGTWIVIGSMLFFGTIVATVTAYFMRPLQRPHKKIIETIEVNLEQLNDLTVEELDLLKGTVDTLISHVEGLKERQQQGEDLHRPG
ncbi:MAG TPA: two pore domain potassium channel family protein [Gammaproteobacteria bacterium]|nr:two pore domain potassium channel family protein [Gammaproteobacteria bacterium]